MFKKWITALSRTFSNSYLTKKKFDSKAMAALGNFSTLHIVTHVSFDCLLSARLIESFKNVLLMNLRSISVSQYLSPKSDIKIS